MNVSIFGLGYVGAVSAACLSKEGHTVIGVDPNPTKVELINAGKSPVVEELVEDYIAEGVQGTFLRATANGHEAITESEMAFICVGTPSQKNGDLDLQFVEHVMEEIGFVLREKKDFFVVVLRSTVLPGTTKNMVIPILEKVSQKKAGKGFGVCFNPEFLREGSGVKDFLNPPKIIIASTDELSKEMFLKVQSPSNIPLIATDFETAEMVKYVDNSWHALKVGFANEIGAISKALSLDGQEVMEIFCKDTKLNLSEKYLKPGFAFGGSCLPKDLRALNYKTRSLDMDLPILGAVMPSNHLHVIRAFHMVTSLKSRKVGVVGLSFKTGTDDLRESPIVDMVERLIGKGYEIKIYDPDVNVASLLGANREFIEQHIPHIAKLLAEDMKSVLSFAETLVIGKNIKEVEHIFEKLSPSQHIVDLIRLEKGERDWENYHGICW